MCGWQQSGERVGLAEVPNYETFECEGEKTACILKSTAVVGSKWGIMRLFKTFSRRGCQSRANAAAAAAAAGI